MPTYSYVCDACGKSFEKEQRISEDPLKKCALCGKAKARRQIVSANFILKGGGWYSDGYGASGGGASKSSAPKAAESSAPKADKSESPKKTETKSSATD
jgi:putative FmdB family regulatory protein